MQLLTLYQYELRYILLYIDSCIAFKLFFLLYIGFEIILELIVSYQFYDNLNLISH